MPLGLIQLTVPLWVCPLCLDCILSICSTGLFPLVFCYKTSLWLLSVWFRLILFFCHSFVFHHCCFMIPRRVLAEVTWTSEQRCGVRRVKWQHSVSPGPWLALVRAPPATATPKETMFNSIFILQYLCESCLPTVLLSERKTKIRDMPGYGGSSVVCLCRVISSP